MVPSSFPSISSGALSLGEPVRPGPRIAFIGEAPGRQEIAKQEVFIGPSGKLLNGVLEHYGVARKEVFLGNATLCHYPDSMKEIPKEAIECCRPRLMEELEQAGVDTIVPMGNSAVKAIFPKDQARKGITQLRVGRPKPLDHFSRPTTAVPTFHPAACLRSQEKFPHMLSDIGKAVSSANLPAKWYEPDIQVIDPSKQGESFPSVVIRALTRPTLFHLDIETSREKDTSYGNVHMERLLCVGIGEEGEDTVFVFTEECFHDEEFRRRFKVFLNTAKLGAQNGKFDLGTLRAYLGYPDFEGPTLSEDTMLASYSLFEYRGVHGLEYMGMELLGTPDWKHDIFGYLKGPDGKGPVDYANVPSGILHKYNAFDVHATRLVHAYLIRKIKEQGLEDAYRFMLRVSNMLTLVEPRGLGFDTAYSQSLTDEYQREREDLERGLPIVCNPEAKSKHLRIPHPLNPDSPDQVKKYYTDHGVKLENTEADTLKTLLDDSRINEEIRGTTQLILDIRAITKTDGTFVTGLRKKVTAEGTVHPSFLIHGTTSGRLSARNPNCYDDETEILTEDGWYLFSQLGEDQKVAQFDAGSPDGLISFVEPAEIVHQDYEGLMISIKSEAVDLLVTPNHRMYSTTRKEDVVKVDSAEYWMRWSPVTNIDRKFFRGGWAVGSRILTEEEIIQLRRAVAVQADGYRRPDMPGRIEVQVRSSRKKDQLVELFEDVRVRGDGDYVAWVDESDVNEWLDHHKNFKISKLLELDGDTLDIFMREIMRWDGDFTRECIYLQHPDRERSVDAVQIAAILSGRSTKRGYYKNNYPLVNVHRKANRPCSNTQVNEVEYKGRVHCVTVPTGAIIVRRNGQAIVSGNSQNIPRADQIKRQFIARSDNRTLVGVDMSQAELRVLTWLAKEELTRDIFNDPSRDLFVELCRSMFPNLFDGHPDSFVKKHPIRPLVKGFAYGIAYGRTAAGIAADPEFNMTVQEAQKHMRVFERTVPSIIAFLEDAADRACRGEELVTAFGRHRRFHLVTNQNKHDIRNEAKSFYAQSTASDIVLEAACRLTEQGVYVCNLVHDAIYCDVIKEEAEYTRDLVAKTMIEVGEEVTEGYVKFAAEGKIGRTWADV